MTYGRSRRNAGASPEYTCQRPGAAASTPANWRFQQCTATRGRRRCVENGRFKPSCRATPECNPAWAVVYVDFTDTDQPFPAGCALSGRVRHISGARETPCDFVHVLRPSLSRFCAGAVPASAQYGIPVWPIPPRARPTMSRSAATSGLHADRADHQRITRHHRHPDRLRRGSRDGESHIQAVQGGAAAGPKHKLRLNTRRSRYDANRVAEPHDCLQRHSVRPCRSRSPPS